MKKYVELTSSKVKHEVGNEFLKYISASTARRVIGQAGCHGRAARKKPIISLIGKEPFVCINKLIQKPPEIRKWVIFSDGSKFGISGIKGRKIVRMKSSMTLKKKFDY